LLYKRVPKRKKRSFYLLAIKIHSADRPQWPPKSGQ